MTWDGTTIQPARRKIRTSTYFSQTGRKLTYMSGTAPGRMRSKIRVRVVDPWCAGNYGSIRTNPASIATDTRGCDAWVNFWIRPLRYTNKRQMATSRGDISVHDRDHILICRACALSVLYVLIPCLTDKFGYHSHCPSPNAFCV